MRRSFLRFVVIGTSLPSTTNSIAETGAPYNKGDIVHDKIITFILRSTTSLLVKWSTWLFGQFIRTNAYVDQSIKLLDRQVDELQFYDNEIYYDDSSNQYFYVVSGMDGENTITNPVDIASFNPATKNGVRIGHFYLNLSIRMTPCPALLEKLFQPVIIWITVPSKN